MRKEIDQNFALFGVAIFLFVPLLIRFLASPNIGKASNRPEGTEVVEPAEKSDGFDDSWWFHLSILRDLGVFE